MRARTKTIEPDVLEVLKNVEIDGNNVRITQQLDRKLYVKTNDALVALGGTWNKKAKAHVFAEDPQQAIAAAVGGGTYESVKDAEKEAGYFPTPVELAKKVVDVAEIRPGHRVLEPSAGQGRIADVIRAEHPDADLYLCELLEGNIDALIAKGYPRGRICPDFLRFQPVQKFDRIVMNPPFSKQADIEHVTRAYEMLAPGGKLVSIMSPSFRYREDKKAKAFRQLVESASGHVVENPEKAFHESGTDVGTVTVVLTKKGTSIPKPKFKEESGIKPAPAKRKYGDFEIEWVTLKGGDRAVRTTPPDGSGSTTLAYVEKTDGGYYVDNDNKPTYLDKTFKSLPELKKVIGGFIEHRLQEEWGSIGEQMKNRAADMDLDAMVREIDELIDRLDIPNARGFAVRIPQSKFYRKPPARPVGAYSSDIPSRGEIENMLQQLRLEEHVRQDKKVRAKQPTPDVVPFIADAMENVKRSPMWETLPVRARRNVLRMIEAGPLHAEFFGSTSEKVQQAARRRLEKAGQDLAKIQAGIWEGVDAWEWAKHEHKLNILAPNAFARMTELEGKAWAADERKHADEAGRFLDAQDAYRILKDSGLTKTHTLADVADSPGFIGANDEIYIVLRDGEIALLEDTATPAKVEKAEQILRVIIPEDPDPFTKTRDDPVSIRKASERRSSSRSEYREGGAEGMTPDQIVAKNWTVHELEAMPRLGTGHFDDLKIKRGDVQVWISRDDGTEKNKVFVERLIDRKWEEVRSYRAALGHKPASVLSNELKDSLESIAKETPERFMAAVGMTSEQANPSVSKVEKVGQHFVVTFGLTNSDTPQRVRNRILSKMRADKRSMFQDAGFLWGQPVWNWTLSEQEAQQIVDASSEGSKPASARKPQVSREAGHERNEFYGALDRYIAAAQNIINDDFARNYPNLTPPELRYETLRKYVRVYTFENGRAGSVHSFVDPVTGDIYKAASWKTPAKHARGNVYQDPKEALGARGGVVYLR